MSNVFETSMEHLPQVAAAAGFVAGSLLEVWAQSGVAANRAALTEAWGDDVVGARESGALRKFAAVAIGPVALMGAAVGFANGMAWQTDTSPKTIPGHLEVVVDHSGATAFGDKPVRLIDGVVARLAKTGLDSQAIVASGGEPKVEKELEDVANDQPFGDAPLDLAVRLAQGNNTAFRADAINKNKAVGSTGTVIITNGNKVGAANEIIAAADGSPVFVINVEPASPDPALNSELKTIAEQTKGQYWDLRADTAQQVSEAVSKTLTKTEARDKKRPANWPNRLLAAAFVGSIPLIYRQRKNMTLTLNGSKGGE